MPTERKCRIQAVEASWKPGWFHWMCACGRASLTTYAYPGLAEAAGLHHQRAMEGR